MIDGSKPDYTFSPVSDVAPHFHYRPCTLSDSDPLVSIITTLLNDSLDLFDTAKSVLRMSFVNWEWLVVDARNETIGQPALAELQSEHPQIRVFHEACSNKAEGCNAAARAARGKYLLLLDSGDLLEPTYLEQAVWVLETRPWFSACNAHGVRFGSHEELVGGGFYDNERTLDSNRILPTALVRCEDYISIGGMDETYSTLAAEWDLWLKLAAARKWGYTISDHLIWMRNRNWGALSERDSRESQRTQKLLRDKYAHLRVDFPYPKYPSDWDVYREGELIALHVANPLAKPPRTHRVLLIVQCMFIGGSDKFNLDFMEELSKRGYEFTVIVTSSGRNDWYSAYSRLTPDIFIFPQFQLAGDSIHFLDHLIESRQIDTVFITHSEGGYHLLPYLRVHHPHLPVVDYIHIEEKVWRNGGYPRMSLDGQALLDYTITSTQHLRQWMIDHGGDPAKIMVCHTNIDAQRWNPAHFDTVNVRNMLGINATDVLILFVGRMEFQKRPMLYAQIIDRLTRHSTSFLSTAIGVGSAMPRLEQYVGDHQLERYVRVLGALPNEKVQELMAAADILLLPSDNEGLALVLFEAMAMATVPVAADVGGHGELVTSDCGYLISHVDDELEKYVAALSFLIDHPVKRAEMAQRGRSRVAEHFSLGQMADTLEEGMRLAHETATQRSEDVLEDVLSQWILPLSTARLKAVESYDWALPYLGSQAGPFGAGNGSGNPLVAYLTREIDKLKEWGNSEYNHHMAADQAYRDAVNQINLLRSQLTRPTGRDLLRAARRVIPRQVKRLVKRSLSNVRST